MELSAFLSAQARGDLLPWRSQVSAAERFGIHLGQVETAALELGLLPARYQRNRQTITCPRWIPKRSAALTWERQGRRSPRAWALRKALSSI
ncbi:MAG: hypothetical protein IH614_05040 [Desulfuromonadales bacterium]|nr:hypothetical protein [Desulfuromonadales bacterium]